MKLNFKKIASVLAGTVMLSSTLAFAAAANNYPTPFIKNGSADVAVVYGSNVGGEFDLAAVTDITLSLQAKLAAQTASSGSTGSTVQTNGGDSYELQKASTKFTLGSGIADIVSTTVTDDDLPTLLANGVYTDTNNDEFDYTQQITLTNQSVSLFEDNDYKADVPTIGMKIASGANVMNYTLSFTDEPDWADLSNTDLTLMGKTYYVLSKSSDTADTLTLLDSADSLIVSEGETKNVTLGGKSYSVKINFVGSNTTKLEINGETTKSLGTSGTYKLKDGAYVGIKEINYNSKDTGISNVEFSIGSGKLFLDNGQDIELNDEAVNDLKAYFTNSSSTKLSSIKIAWYADGDLFATNDSSIVMPGFNATKLSFAGMTFPASEKIAVEPDSDDSFVLKSFPMTSTNADINLLYWSGSAFTLIGADSSKLLRTSSTSTLTFDADTDAYWVASWTDGTDSESYLMRATSFVIDSSVNKTTIQYMKDGAWVDLKEDAKAGDSISSLGNIDLLVGAINKDAKTVVMNYTGSGASFNTLYSKDGLKVYLPYNTTASGVGAINLSASPATYSLIFSEEDKDGNVAKGQNITLTLGDNTQDDTSVTAVTLTKGSSAIETGDSKVDTYYVYSPLATEVTYDRSDDQRSATLTYHGDESYANLFLSAPNTVITTTPGTPGSVVRELGSVFLKDTEVSQVSGKNLIVVGGSCVNKLSSELLGGAACGTDWETKTGVGSGAFLIQTFERTGGKVATLVAGYSVEDTRNAAKVLVSDASIDLSAGKKYKSTSATSVSLVTTAA